jgi:hypothetical protein
MNRRTLLGMISSLPFCGWMKQKWLTTDDATEFVVIAIGYHNEFTVGRNAILYDAAIFKGSQIGRFIGFNCKRNLHCFDAATADDFDRIEQVGLMDDLSGYLTTEINPTPTRLIRGGCWRGKTLENASEFANIVRKVSDNGG